MVVERLEHALAARRGQHVHALEPPELSVAPVAPLVCNHQLSDRQAGLVLGDEVASVGVVCQRRTHAAANDVRIERPVFGLERHRLVAAGEELEVGRDGVADVRFAPHLIIITVARVRNP